MTVTITIEAQGPFSGDQRPARSGVYRRVDKSLDVNGGIFWSHYNARTKIWGVYMTTPTKAHVWRDRPSRHQRLPGYALPYDLPAGTRLERIEGLVFRVIPPKS